MIDTITRVISPIPLPQPLPMPQKESMNNNFEGQVVAMDGGAIMVWGVALINAGLAILAGILAGGGGGGKDDGNDDNNDNNNDDDNE